MWLLAVRWNVLELNRSNLGLKYKKKLAITRELLYCDFGFHSIQVDASCFPNGFVDMGCVIRDHDRKPVLVASKIIVSSAGSLVA